MSSPNSSEGTNPESPLGCGDDAVGPNGAPWRTVARVGEIAPATGKGFVVEGRLVAVFFDGSAHYAIDDFCPHQGAELHDGLVFDQSVTCRHHGWRFCLKTGRWIDGRRDGVEAYPVRVVGDEIQVAVPSS